MNTVLEGTFAEEARPSANDACDNRRIGAILVDEGKLRIQDAERILYAQKEKGLRFGEAAIALGLVTESDIQRALSLQHDYPYLLPNESKVSRKLGAAYEPFGKQGEALRALRSQLLLRWFSGESERRTLAVVSPDRGDGRSVLCANLAIVFSQLGESTLPVWLLLVSVPSLGRRGLIDSDPPLNQGAAGADLQPVAGLLEMIGPFQCSPHRTVGDGIVRRQVHCHAETAEDIWSSGLIAAR